MSNFEVWQGGVQILFSMITDCMLVGGGSTLTTWALARPQFLHPRNGYNDIGFTVFLYGLNT